MPAQEEVLENQIFLVGVGWREAFVVPFIAGTVPAWSDACFNAVDWDGLPPSAHASTGSGWAVVCSPATDAEGWVYGTAFDHLRDERPGGRASKRANDRVRCRLWRRCGADGSGGGGGAPQARPAAAAAPRGGGSDGSDATSPRGPGQRVAAAAASAGKAALAGAVHAVQQSVPGAVKRASFAGMANTFLRLVKDAAARHNTAMITPDITGWFFVVASHSEALKRQQLGQLRQLVWFSATPALTAAMRPAGMGSNPPGVVLPAGPALAASRAQQQQQSGGAGAGAGAAPGAGALPRAQPVADAPADASEALANAAATCAAADSSGGGSNSSSGGGGRPRAGPGRRSRSGSSSGKQHAASHEQQQQHHHHLPGLPFEGVMLQLGGSRQRWQEPAGLQLHVGPLSMLDDLLAGARYSQAAYGYVAAAGHMSSVSNALKLLATLPLFDPITGVSLQANTQALMSLAGFAAEDVLLTAWHNDTFRPCHYVAVDAARRCIVIGVRGSLELGDLETDVTAAPLPFEFQGVAGWVHEGLLAAAAYVVANTVDALAEAAARHPGWPLVVAGHSLGGGVAALVTLLLQQPGAAPRGISGVRCIAIGPAAVLSQELSSLCEHYVTSIVIGADAIPRLSTYSVESLLLDLVNASLSHRVTSQLAATTSSVAASTAGALNSLAAGLTRLANSATSNVTNVTSSLAGLSPVLLGGLPLSLGGLTAGLSSSAGSVSDAARAAASALGGPASAGMAADGLHEVGTGSIEMSRLALLEAHQRQQQQQQRRGGAGSLATLPHSADGGLKRLHVILQGERQQEQLRRASMEQQQQQQQQQGLPVADAAAVAAQEQQAAAANAAGVAASQRSASPAAGGSAPPPGKAAAAAPGSPADRLDGGTSSQQPGRPATLHCSAQRTPGSAKKKAPGGARLVSGGALSSASSQPALACVPSGSASSSSSSQQGALLFSHPDDACLISGIQQACAELSQPAPQEVRGLRTIRAATPATQPSRGRGGSGRVSPLDVDAGAAPAMAAAAAPATAGRAGSAASASSGALSRSSSEPALQQWASDGLQPLGEPSWARLSRESSRGSHSGAANGSGSGSGAAHHQAQHSQDAGAAGRRGGAGDSTVHALESDLKRTARLYPPGRIFWVLSEELVGPAAHQLMSAVAAHLPQQPSAAPGASSAPSPRSAAAADVSPFLAAAGEAAPGGGSSGSGSSGSGQLQPPLQAHMAMPASVMSCPVPEAQRPRPQQRPVSSRVLARDTARAHAVAAAAAQHILADVHSLDAKRSAVAALHAAQHEHPPLHLSQQQSADDTAAELQRQQLLQQADLQAGDAAAQSGAGAADAGAAAAQQQPKQPRRQAQQQQQQQQQQQPHDVQMTATGHGAAVGSGSGRGGSSGSGGCRASSAPMEVDGSAAARLAGAGWPSPEDVDPSQLPDDLAGLLTILGRASDAATALAISHKKQLLLQHFWQQRRRDAAAQAAAAAAGGDPGPAGQQQQQQQQQRGSASGGGSSRRRSSSDSVLLCYQDMVAAVDDAATHATGAGTTSPHARWQHGHGGAAPRPQLELAEHGSWGACAAAAAAAAAAGDAASSGGGSGHAAARSVPGRSSGGGRGHSRGHSWSPAHSAAEAAAPPPRPGSGPDSRRSSPGGSSGEGMWGLRRTLSGSGASAQEQQQALQLSLFEQSDTYMAWAAQQAALHRQQLEAQQQRQQQQQQAPGRGPQPQRQQQPAGSMSIQDLAVESLIELAQLPERIAESFGALKLGGGSEPDSSLAALCAPVVAPASSAAAGAAAGEAGGSTPRSGPRLPPVVVLPERDVFGSLLLHKTAVTDHLPSNYVRVMQQLRDAYVQLPAQLAAQAAAAAGAPATAAQPPGVAA